MKSPLILVTVPEVSVVLKTLGTSLDKIIHMSTIPELEYTELDDAIEDGGPEIVSEGRSLGGLSM